MNKGKLIGKGMTAEVYEWGQDKVIKLYYSRFNEEWIRNEAEIGHRIHDAGVPSPAVFDMVNIDGRIGIIFERIYGKSMLRQAEAEPMNIRHFAHQVAALQFKIHRCYTDNLPPQKEKFISAIKDSNRILGKRINIILDYLDSLPKGDSICHGDLHFGNIIVSKNSLIAIDWRGAYTGNPLGDVARTCLMLSSPNRPTGTPCIAIMSYKIGKQLTYEYYMNEYMRIAKVSYKKIDSWMLPVAAARLREKIPGEKRWLIGIIDKHLEKLYD